MRILLILLILSIAALARAYTKDQLEIAEKYYSNQLKTTPFKHEFRASEESDVPDITKFSPEKRAQLMKLAMDSLAANQGVIAILAAGASTRMNPLEAPESVRKILGDKDIKSKASVPLGLLDNKPVTFLGAFLMNIARFDQQLSKARDKKIALPVLILSNDEYRPELDEQLRKNNYFGLDPHQLIFLHQQLGDQMIATPEDAAKASEKLENPADKKAALAISEQAEREFKKGEIDKVMLPNEQAPLGHGEFFHQLISSGTFLKLYEQGHKWISVRNIDNSAATFDENWLVILGNFLNDKLDMQVEVSPRTADQKGRQLDY